ncbi:MAG: hypothetical protein HY559_04240 [Gammaproteobacteria bacterium]|nr:hypothetical protein [Gammaproteobacteria bacterium]
MYPLTSHSAFRTCFVLGMFLATGILGAVPNEPLSDPTAPPPEWFRVKAGEGITVQESKWAVQSVLVSPRRKIAIINNKMVKPGESIEGQEVVDIRLEGVVLKGAEGERIVSLPGVAIKQ